MIYARKIIFVIGLIVILLLTCIAGGLILFLNSNNSVRSHHFYPSMAPFEFRTTRASILSDNSTSYAINSVKRDIIILLDNSSSMKSPKNFNKIKSWLCEQLLPKWIIDADNIQIGFALYSVVFISYGGNINVINLKIDFNYVYQFSNNNIDIFGVIRDQLYVGQYNASVTNALKNAVEIIRVRSVPETIILISASEDPLDILEADSYSEQKNRYPNQIITLALNSESKGKYLGQLSKRNEQFFGVSDFLPTEEIAYNMTQFLKNDKWN